MTEAALQRKCTKYAKALDVLVWKVSAEHQRGLPDLLLIFPGGAVVLVEMKGERGRLSAQQDHTIKKIHDQGATVYVCHSYENFQQIIERHHPGTGGCD